MGELILDGHSLTIDEFDECARDITAQRKIVISISARERMQRYRDELKRLIQRGEIIYGVNTGIGALKSRRIPQNQMAEYQRTLIQSHKSGWGHPMP
ncbi:MAG: aromatic amino acid lyase, partial [bacterium]